MELVPMSPVWRFQTAGQEEEGGGDRPREAHGPPRAEAGEGRLVRALARRHTLPCLHYGRDRRGVEENASPWSGGPKERVGAGYGVAKMLKWPKAPISWTGPCLKAGWSFPGGSVVKTLPANARDTGLIPGSGRSPQGGNHNPLQRSCLGNPTDRGAWRATVHGVLKDSDMTERLSNKKDGGDDGPQGLRQVEPGSSQPAGCHSLHGNGVHLKQRVVQIATGPGLETPSKGDAYRGPGKGALFTGVLVRGHFTGVMLTLQKTTQQQTQGALGQGYQGDCTALVCFPPEGLSCVCR